jgi:predicted nucleic acid-binding protein
VPSAVFDTNILIDFTLGVPGAAIELRESTPKLISIVSWMEVLVGAQDANDELRLHQFLERFTLIRLSDSLAERTVRVRREYGLKLPDAIIYATALEHNLTLITRNTKDFSDTMPYVRIPYRL